jgi:predicted permease
MAAGYVNAANLGIPVAVQVLGNASFLAFVLLLQTLIVTPIILGTLDLATRADGDGRWRRLLTLPLRSPVLLACALGVSLGAAGVRLPGLLDSIVALLGAAAVPTALVALGLSLVGGEQGGRRPERGLRRPSPPIWRGSAGAHRPRQVAASVALKVLVQPGFTFVVGRFLFGLHGADLLAVVICAGLPTAQNTFVFARAYDVDGRFLRDCIVASTALSMVTLTLAATVVPHVSG